MMYGTRGVSVAPHPSDMPQIVSPRTRAPPLQPLQLGSFPPPNLRQTSRLERAMTLFGYSLAPLYDAWERVQVSHCGQYSVERMLALDEYCKRVSFARVVAVCALTPLFPLLVVILTECAPLRPTTEGATANYVFWIRHSVMVVFMVVGSMLQARAWVPELPLSNRQIVAVACSCASIVTVLGVLVADLWVFPIPFLAVVGAPVLLPVWGLSARLALGPDALVGIQDGEFRGRQYLLLSAAQTSLMIIYPGYQALFFAVDDFWQLVLVAALPGVNLFMKNVLAYCGSHLEDNLPEVIVFSVEVFHALYSALCMRSANSLTVVGITVALNTIVMALSLHGMNCRSRVAMASQRLQCEQLRQERLQQRKTSTETPPASVSLLSTLVVSTLKLLQTPGQLDTSGLREIRLLSGKQHNLSDENTKLLAALAARCVYNNDRRKTEAVTMSMLKSRYASAAMGATVRPELHFATSPPRSHFIQRLRMAVQVIPDTVKQGSAHLGARLGSSRAKLGSRLGSSLGFRVDSRQNVNTVQDVDAESDADSFAQVHPDLPWTARESFARPSSIDARRKASAKPSIPWVSRDSFMLGQAPLVSSPRISQLVAASSRWGSERRPSSRTSSEQASTLEENRVLTTAPEPTLVQSISEAREASEKLRPLLIAGKPVMNDVLRETRRQNTTAVNQTLQLLFNNEYLGLIAYTQCIVPIVYIAYIVVLRLLPNRAYYPLHDGFLDDRDKFLERITIIAVLAGLQLVVLLVLHVFVASRFAVSTLYQVAFVMETHVTLVQGRLLIWIIFVVQSTLEHYGVDFAFKFAWMREESSGSLSSSSMRG